MVANALSHKTIETLIGTICYKKDNLVALRAMNINLDGGENHLMATLQVKVSLVDQIRDTQMEDPYLKKMKEKVEAGDKT